MGSPLGPKYLLYTYMDPLGESSGPQISSRCKAWPVCASENVGITMTADMYGV